MKKLVFIFLVTLSAAKQSQAQITFQKNYGTNQGDWASKIIQDNNGEYILTGVTRGYGAGGDIYLLKTDNTGNIKWFKDLFGVNTDNPYEMIKNQDGGLSIIGSTLSFGVGNTDGIFITTDSLGNVKGAVTYGTATEDDELYSIQKINNGFILGGTCTSNFTGPAIYRTDSLGSIIWSFVLPVSENQDIIKSVYQTSDNGFILLRSKAIYNGYFFSFIKLDQNGNFIWAKQYATLSSNLQMGASKMVHTTDNGFIITGSTYQNAVGAGADIFLLKVDSVANPIWFKTYGGVFYEFGVDVIETPDRGYAVTGNTNSFGFGSTDAILLKTDSLGTFKWAKTYGNVWDDYSESLIQTLDGGYAFVGRTVLNGTNVDSVDVLFIKTDSAGNSSCRDTTWYPMTQNTVYNLTTTTHSLNPYGETTFPVVISSSKYFNERDFCLQTGFEEFNSSKINISISPNPFSTSASVEVYGHKGIGEIRFEMFDVIGREVTRSVIPSGTRNLTIKRENLSSGIYFYKLSAPSPKGEGWGEVIGTGKVVIE